MAFGQGGTVVTPIEQAVAYATFADNGTRYQPEVGAGIVSPDGKVVKAFAPKVTGHVTMSASDHQAMLSGFVGAVQASNGTAFDSFTGFPFSQMSLAGKTGTASARETVPTSWFVGWGPVADPQYLIAVVIEKGGYGASAAAPVAKDGFTYLLSNPVQPVDLKAAAKADSEASSSTSTTTTVPGGATSGSTTSTVPGAKTTAAGRGTAPLSRKASATGAGTARSVAARSGGRAVALPASDGSPRGPPDRL
jgi:penicillin-binding protein 2